MCDALIEIMEPKLEEVRIQGAVETLRSLQYKNPEIKSAIMKQYGLTEEEANNYLQPS